MRHKHSPVDGNQAETPHLLCSDCRKTFPLHAIVPLKLLPSGCCLLSAGGSAGASAAGSALGKTHEDISDQRLQIVYNKLIGSASHRLPCCQIPVGLSPALRSSDR